jgi:hypothetical protein
VAQTHKAKRNKKIFCAPRNNTCFSTIVYYIPHYTTLATAKRHSLFLTILYSLDIRFQHISKPDVLHYPDVLFYFAKDKNVFVGLVHLRTRREYIVFGRRINNTQVSVTKTKTGKQTTHTHTNVLSAYTLRTHVFFCIVIIEDVVALWELA